VSVPPSRALRLARYGRPHKVLEVTFAPRVDPPDAHGVLARTEKIRFAIADAATHVHLRHAVDGPAFRVLAQAVLADRFATVAARDPATGVLAWIDYKGWGDGPTAVSNRLRVAYDARQREPWSLAIAEGPGRRLPTGAVTPAGPAAAQVAFRLTAAEWTALCAQGLEALAAFTTLCLAALVAAPPPAAPLPAEA